MLGAVRGVLRDGALAVIRPRVTVSSALFKNAAVTAPYGDPFPWPIGLAVLLVVAAFLGGLFVHFARRVFA